MLSSAAARSAGRHRRAAAAQRRRHAHGAILVATLALGVWAPPAAGQLVYGFVVDSTSAQRLPATSLVLLDTLERPVATGFAGEDGAFAMRAPRGGIYRLRVSRLGYEELTEVVDLRTEPSSSLLLRLYAKPVELPALTVLVRAVRLNARLRDGGFYYRQKMGFGHFLTPEMIARRPLLNVTDIFRGLVRSFTCEPAILVDGMLRTNIKLNEVVSAEDIAAAEIYYGAVGVPVQVNGMFGLCGAVVLWTKR